MEDIHKLERRLDNSIFGGLKMHVNTPKFERAQVRKTLSAAKRRECVEQIAMETNSGRQQGAGMKQGSYAEVVMRNVPRPHQRRTSATDDHNTYRSRSSVYLDISLTGQKWLNEAWVGRLKNPALFDRVKDDLLWDIGTNISPKYIGDDMVLLLGLTNDKAKRMIDVESEGGDSLFYSLEKWNPRMRTGYS